jgi:phosphate uptake regulator
VSQPKHTLTDFEEALAPAEVELILTLGGQAMEMFRDSVEAYPREDVALGRALKERDKRWTR